MAREKLSEGWWEDVYALIETVEEGSQDAGDIYMDGVRASLEDFDQYYDAVVGAEAQSIISLGTMQNVSDGLAQLAGVSSVSKGDDIVGAYWRWVNAYRVLFQGGPNNADYIIETMSPEEYIEYFQEAVDTYIAASEDLLDKAEKLDEEING